MVQPVPNDVTEFAAAALHILVPDAPDTRYEIPKCINQALVQPLEFALDISIGLYGAGLVAVSGGAAVLTSFLYLEALEPCKSDSNTTSVATALEGLDTLLTDFVDAVDFPFATIAQNYIEDEATLAHWGAQMVDSWHQGKFYNAGQMFGKLAHGVLVVPAIPDEERTEKRWYGGFFDEMDRTKKISSFLQ